jgi:hypothetical protein
MTLPPPSDDTALPQRATPGRRTLMLALLACIAAGPGAVAEGLYAWRDVAAAPGQTLERRFAPPSGFERIAAAPDSFAAWLRALPLQEDGARVQLHTGAEKRRQDVHAAVVAIDTGTRDLQQCADAIMRLRAEWLFGAGRLKDIAFTMTEGGRVPFSRWAKGERPSPSGKMWKRTASPDTSHASLRRYLDFVFSYAGTASLEKELAPVTQLDGLAPGDVFIKGGFPGHAVLVADVAVNPVTKAKRFLLIQSYMPAQDMHVLRNPENPDGSPWYSLPPGPLVTPEWTFPAGSLRRWR